MMSSDLSTCGGFATMPTQKKTKKHAFVYCWVRRFECMCVCVCVCVCNFCKITFFALHSIFCLRKQSFSTILLKTD
jgi:hypothetical protein